MVRSIPKYSDQYEHDSPYVKELKERKTVNTALWNSSGGKKQKCDICKQTLVMPKGQTYLQCPSCGKITYPELKQENKTLADPNANTGPIIVSQVKKKRRASSLDEQNGIDDETLDDLRSMGIEPTSWKDYFPT